MLFSDLWVIWNERNAILLVVFIFSVVRDRGIFLLPFGLLLWGPSRIPLWLVSVEIRRLHFLKVIFHKSDEGGFLAPPVYFISYFLFIKLLFMKIKGKKIMLFGFLLFVWNDCGISHNIEQAAFELFNEDFQRLLNRNFFLNLLFDKYRNGLLV